MKAAGYGVEMQKQKPITPLQIIGGGWTISPPPAANPQIKTAQDKKNPLTGREVWNKMQGERADYMNKAYELQNQQNNWNGGLQSGKMLCDMMSNIFTHVVNMEQLSLHGKFMYYQHDIAKKGLELEGERLDVAHKMQGEQLKYQLTVARYQKETAVTVAAIQQKGKTKRVQALAALRGFYSHGRPASPFQRVMT